MNTLHIFGDSFSDDVENNFFLPKGNETDFRWYNAIRQNSYLINHSKGAIGPQYCFHKFLSFFDTFRENDNVVLVMSQRTRLQFPFLRSDNDAPASVSENAALQVDGWAGQGLLTGSTQLPPG